MVKKTYKCRKSFVCAWTVEAQICTLLITALAVKILNTIKSIQDYSQGVTYYIRNEGRNGGARVEKLF